MAPLPYNYRKGKAANNKIRRRCLLRQCSAVKLIEQYDSELDTPIDFTSEKKMWKTFAKNYDNNPKFQKFMNTELVDNIIGTGDSIVEEHVLVAPRAFVHTNKTYKLTPLLNEVEVPVEELEEILKPRSRTPAPRRRWWFPTSKAPPPSTKAPSPSTKAPSSTPSQEKSNLPAEVPLFVMLMFLIQCVCVFLHT